MYPFYTSTRGSYQRAPLSSSFSYPIHTPNTSYLNTFSTVNEIDEEEFLLRSALERKQHERLARRQYHQQQQAQLEHLRQLEYENLLRIERERQQAAAAAALAQAEQEALLKYQRRQLQKQQQQQRVAAYEALILQRQQQQAVARYHTQAQAAARSHKLAIAEAKRRQQHQQQFQFIFQHTSDNDEVETESEDDEDSLNNLLEALFFPHQKRPQPRKEDKYPCKRHQQCHQEKDQGIKRVKQAANEKEKELKKQSEHETASKTKPTADSAVQEQESLLVALPEILTFIDALFGGGSQTPQTSSKAESSSFPSKRSGCRASASCTSTTASESTSGPSSATADSRASDILQARSQRQDQTTQSLHQKHSSLNVIESSLDSFAYDLNEALDSSVATEDYKRKIVLAAEESVSKAMIEIDSVDSDGDLSVRQRRKELIKKSQDLLERVDGWKSRESNTGKKVLRNIPVSSITNDESEAEATASASFTAASAKAETSKDSEVIVLEAGAEKEIIEEANEGEPADVVDALPDTNDVPIEDNNEGDDENVQPYNVTIASVSSPSESVTVQEDDKEESTNVAVNDVIESAVAVDEDTQVEKDVTVKDKEVKVTSTSSESGHDDFEIVPEF
ncbi:hypothetical protein FBU30_004258 [Linnemannia zychae]|nr:hypothetical protein FBU30_004258 [Linnemannia zychae]